MKISRKDAALKAFLVTICTISICACSKSPEPETTPPAQSATPSTTESSPAPAATGTSSPVTTGTVASTSETTATAASEPMATGTAAPAPTTTATTATTATASVPAQPQDVTSIQFTQTTTGTPLAATDVAGAIPVAHWNAVQTGGDYANQVMPGGADQATVSASNGMVNAAGAPSGVGYTLVSYGYLKTGASTVSGANGNLVAGGAITRGTGSEAPLPVSLTVSGLDPGEAYKIIVYTSGGANELTYGSLGLTGGPTYYFETAEGDGGGNSLTDLENNSSRTDAISSGTAGTPIPAPEALKSNYIEFDGVTGSSTATFALTELGAWAFGVWAPVPADNSHSSLGIAGVQVIDTGKRGQAPASAPVSGGTQAAASPAPSESAAPAGSPASQ